MNYSIRYNRTTNHITGFNLNASATDTTMNTCGSVTRSTLAQGKSFETLAEVRAYIETAQRRICKNCLKALDAAIAAEAEAAAETVTYEPFGTEVLPVGVTMDANRILSGPAKDLLDMYRRRIAVLTADGSLALL